MLVRGGAALDPGGYQPHPPGIAVHSDLAPMLDVRDLAGAVVQQRHQRLGITHGCRGA